MRKVGIHLEDILIVVLMRQRPLESFYICRAEPEFSGALLDEKLSFKLRRDKSLHDVRSAVRAAVVDNKDVERLLKREYSTYNLLYILLLIIRWNYYYTVAWSHDVMCLFLYSARNSKVFFSKYKIFPIFLYSFYIGMFPCFFGGLL